MYVLGVESSCDETSCAVLRGNRVLSNVTISSLRQHKPYGGVVPEVATRAHLKNIDKVTVAALAQARVSLSQIGLFAVTAQPGLVGALVVGINFTKALALALNKPVVEVDHLHAHLFAPFLRPAAEAKGGGPRIEFPFIGLVVSGGHTDLYLVKDFTRVKLIGATQDDACGEAYDKVARAFGLGYPGGPLIDKRFDARLRHEYKFNCGRRGFDLSFSGVKTALVYKKIRLQEQGGPGVAAKASTALLSSFQHSVVEAIVSTAIDAAAKYGIKRIVCGGGVTANRYLRQVLAAKARGQTVYLPRIAYATDNAAMVAGLGFYLYNKGDAHRI